MNNKEKFQFGYVPQLDGMRGVAVLAVMVFHAGVIFMPGGFIGVDIFFVLSGFLITSLLIREYDKYGSINFKHFYMRRALRLLPALILLLFLFSVLSVCFLEWTKVKSNLEDAIIVLFYVANWARAFHIHGAGWLGHAWSLSIEEQFYILWPITLVLLLRRIRSRRNIFLLVLLFATLSWVLRLFLTFNGSSIARLYNGLDTRADSLLIGCALGIFLSSGLISSKAASTLSKILKFLSPIATLVLIVIILTTDVNGLYVYNWLLVVIELSAGVLILDIFISKKSLFKKVFSNKVLVWIGSISYGLYLWHYPLFMLMYDLGLGKLIIPIGVPSTFIIASCSFYFWERPFLKLKNKLSSFVKPEGRSEESRTSLSYNTTKKNIVKQNDDKVTRNR